MSASERGADVGAKSPQSDICSLLVHPTPMIGESEPEELTATRFECQGWEKFACDRLSVLIVQGKK